MSTVEILIFIAAGLLLFFISIWWIRPVSMKWGGKLGLWLAGGGENPPAKWALPMVVFAAGIPVILLRYGVISERQTIISICIALPAVLAARFWAIHLRKRDDQ
jgi:hypothetical protein